VENQVIAANSEIGSSALATTTKKMRRATRLRRKRPWIQPPTDIA
jgi:hypothetical protein